MPGDDEHPEADLSALAGTAGDAVGRMHGALLGSPLALAEDRARAEAIEEAFPGTSALFKAATGFAGRFAEWAVAERGCGGVLFAATGMPGPVPRWHAEAAELAPEARFAYAADEVGARLRSLALEGDGQARAFRGSVLDPGLLRSPEAAWAAQGRGLGLYLHLLLHNLPLRECKPQPGRARRRLPPGSAVAVTGMLLGAGPEGRELARLLGSPGWPVHAHAEEDVIAWVKAAGMTVDEEGVTDVRQWRHGHFHPQWRGRPEGRMVAVVGLVS